MRLLRLYIENFMCHEKSYIDFSQFSSALIIGKLENNDEFSNGVGKTTIFKAIEYCLFNQADVTLEKIIRDFTDICKITLDFALDSTEYRLIRKRTRKGSADISLYEKKSTDGEVEEVYHTQDNVPIISDKFWKDISGRRAADTEKELEKLIKINFKSFRGIVHFVQNDFSGLATATPEKRKAFLKDILNLIVYLKLEKIAKDKTNSLIKEIDKLKIISESFGNIEDELINLNNQIIDLNIKSAACEEQLILLQDEKNREDNILNDYVSQHKELENNYKYLLDNKNNITQSINDLENSIKEYKNKKNTSAQEAKSTIEAVNNIKNKIQQLLLIDLTNLEILPSQIDDLKQKVAELNVIIQTNIAEYDKLSVPLPDDSVCKHCRQKLTDEHKQICKAEILQNMQQCQTIIKNSKQELNNVNSIIAKKQQSVNELLKVKNELISLNNDLIVKDKEIKDKKNIYNEYTSLVEKFQTDLKVKNEELIKIQIDLDKSSLIEGEKILSNIHNQKNKISTITAKFLPLNKEITHINSSLAVVKHSIDQKKKDQVKLKESSLKILDLEKKYKVHSLVCQAFSSTGIPNLIIQNVLDDLQNKSNNLLGQLRPGLQLQFVVEKIKDNGSVDSDTLDIKYHVHGKERYYEQLSGAMKLAVAFSLKLGLSFLLQEVFGTNIQFLLLDEIDQALDKASVDAFADIIKFLQKNFTVLIITHNDRLKDKFKHIICVEQDINMISTAKIMSC